MNNLSDEDPHTCITHINFGVLFPDAAYLWIIQLRNFIRISNYVVVLGLNTQQVILLDVLKYMVSDTNAMLMFSYIFRKHKYSDSTVLIVCTATIYVYIYLIPLTLQSRSCALTHVTESACETFLDYALNSDAREVADT
jgi:hypothetical protein